METTGRGRLQTWIVMGAAVFVVLYMLAILIHESYRLPGEIAAVTESPPVGRGPVETVAPTVVTFPLSALNGSEQEGTVTLKASAGRTMVTIDLSGAPATAEPAHIHSGVCPGVGEVRYQLGSVINGKSETTLGVSLTQVLSDLPLSVNVHKSTRELSTYVACGAIAD